MRRGEGDDDDVSLIARNGSIKGEVYSAWLKDAARIYFGTGTECEAKSGPCASLVSALTERGKERGISVS